MSLIGRDGPRIAAELRAEQAEADAEHWRSEAMRHVDRIGVIEQQLQGAVGAGLWVNAERTVLVRRYEDGELEVATRPEPGASWGPPITVHPEPGQQRMSTPPARVRSPT